MFPLTYQAGDLFERAGSILWDRSRFWLSASAEDRGPLFHKSRYGFMVVGSLAEFALNFPLFRQFLGETGLESVPAALADRTQSLGGT
jgi:hypothetical protein